MLRLEDLFAKILYYIESDHNFHHHCALIGLFHLLDTTDRLELKSDLLRELERQKTIMQNLRSSPAISAKLLDQIIEEIETAAQSMRARETRPGQTLRDNEWLMSIKHRSSLPGGACGFDAPSYQHWLHQPDSQRSHDLRRWLAPLMPLHDSVRVLLHILRGSGSPAPFVARKGFFQQILGGSKDAQLLRVTLDDGLNCFPEISASKYAININFSTTSGKKKSRPCDADVPFGLTLCTL